MQDQSSSIEIDVNSEYLDNQSDPDDNRFVFAYTIKIRNKGAHSAKLLRRHWIITDANGETLEVKGEGVVGEQPVIAPGDEYQYTSGTVLNEFMGCMQGSYQMQAEDGTEFETPIPVFTLVQPDKLH
jgi:ApaG protein